MNARADETAKNYLHVQNTSCNMYMAFTFLVYYLTFPLLLRSYNFNNIISENILTVTGEFNQISYFNM